MNEDNYRSHTYVECCDGYRLMDRTTRVWLDHAWLRICREGMGCTTWNDPTPTA